MTAALSEGPAAALYTWRGPRSRLARLTRSRVEAEVARAGEAWLHPDEDEPAAVPRPTRAPRPRKLYPVTVNTHIRHLTTAELAARYGISPRTAEGWRQRGYGPRSIRVGGGIRYRLADIEAWEETGPPRG